MKKGINISILVLLFTISVLIRLPHIHITPHTTNEQHIFLLTTLEIWSERGITDCHFSPIQTYTNEGDKFVTYFPRLVSPDGDNYYVSYPPFTFISTYAIIKLFGIPPTPLPLYIINLLLHFICAVFIFLLVNSFFGKEITSIFIPSLLAYAIYLFIPAILELHLQTYFPEMLGQVFLVICIYFAYRFFKGSYKNARIYIILLSVLNFVIIYTEWIGVFYAFTILIICLLNFKKDKNYRHLFFAILITSFLSIALTVFQYGLIDGAYSMVRSFVLRYACRSGYFVERYSEGGLNIYNTQFYATSIGNFYRGLFIYPYLLLLFCGSFLFFKKTSTIKQFLIRHYPFILLILLPVSLHAIIFANFTISHSHAFAKLTIPIAVAIGICSHYLLNERKEKFREIIRYSSFLIVGCVIISSVYFYQKNYSHYDPNPYLVETAETIKNNATPDELILININSDHYLPAFYLTYYAKRNIANVKSLEDAKDIVKKLNRSKGVYFIFDQFTGEKSIYHFEIK